MRSLFWASICMAFMVGSAGSATPNLISYQGHLTDSVGNPVADGNHSLEFSLWTDSVSGSQVWVELQNPLVTGGLFDVLLGTINPLHDSLFTDSMLWFEIEFGGVPMLPRTRLASVPYAKRSSVAESLEMPETTRRWTIPGAALLPGDPATMDVVRTGQHLAGSTPGQVLTLYAPVTLPDGANIKEVHVFVVDDDALNVQIALFTTPGFGDVSTIFPAVFSSSGASTSSKEFSSGPIAHTYNADAPCWLDVRFATPTPPNQMIIHQLQIVYTIDDPVY